MEGGRGRGRGGNPLHIQGLSQVFSRVLSADVGENYCRSWVHLTTGGSHRARNSVSSCWLDWESLVIH